MADEIRPVRIPVPRRVREVSREDREENEERFRKKLAEALEDEDKAAGDEGDARGRKPDEAGPEPDDDTPLGHNIDLRT